jgi:hypothetical protein
MGVRLCSHARQVKARCWELTVGPTDPSDPTDPANRPALCGWRFADLEARETADGDLIAQ